MSADDAPRRHPTRWEWEVRDGSGGVVRPGALLDWQGRSAATVAADLVALLLARTPQREWPGLAGWSVRVHGAGGEHVERLDDWPIPRRISAR